MTLLALGLRRTRAMIAEELAYKSFQHSGHRVTRSKTFAGIRSSHELKAKSQEQNYGQTRRRQ